MPSLDLNHWLLIALGALTLFPIGILINQYRRTYVLDYLIFAGFFITGSFAIIGTFFSSLTNLLFFYQLQHMGFNCAFFCLFLHAVRILWDRAPLFIWYFGVIWFSILIFLIFFWEIMPQPERAIVLFWEMPASSSISFPNGAGIATSNGIIIYSTSHRILGDLYRFYTVGLLLYAYFVVEPVYPSARIILARRLWIIVCIVFSIRNVVVLPWLAIGTLSIPLLVVGSIIVAYIAILLPEAMLISHVQVLRATALYNRVQELQIGGRIEEIGNKSLIEYLNSIPSEHLAHDPKS